MVSVRTISMCANCEAINGPESRRMAQSSVRAGCCMVITLDSRSEQESVDFRRSAAFAQRDKKDG
jgi:hypothetical protein